MRSSTAVAIGASIMVIGWAVSKTPTSDTSVAVHSSTAPTVETAFARPAAETAKESAQLKSNPAHEGGAGVTEVKPAKVWPDRPFEYQRDLDAFGEIRRKVFLSTEEKSERNRLLHDSALLRALGLRLTEASLAQSVVASQDAAVDLLIEALKSGDKALASQVAEAVIEDPQVENATLDHSVRENLAGIKAEVLYHWAALMPDEAAHIGNRLPGPVSQKIWANVSHRHASNAAESSDEISARGSH